MRPMLLRIAAAAALASCGVTGCTAPAQIVRNEKAPARKYEHLYLLKSEADPRNITPLAVEQFEQMGLKVRVIEHGKSIEGAEGTAFLISSDGYAVTCAHVVGDEPRSTLWFSNIRYEADVVHKDLVKDLALLKVKAATRFGVEPLSFRSAYRYSIGQDVFTLGFPISRMLGNNLRFTNGSLSSTAGLHDDPDRIQISAEVQPGNSGGPLLDQAGQVIGIVQQTLNPWAVAESTGGSLPQNVNFALKSDVLLQYLQATVPYPATRLSYNRVRTFDSAQAAVAKIRAGVQPAALDAKPKLVATIKYVSVLDMWYRFRVFIVSLYDFDTGEVILRAGRGSDTVASSEDAVIEATFEKVREALSSP
ncbi:MAG TPA: serine protease [Solimonas sp.]|nr:serine protease [Solimonas sp.]